MKKMKKEKIELWGYRKPQGQCAVFEPHEVSAMRRFVGSGGTIRLRIVHDDDIGIVGATSVDFEIE